MALAELYLSNVRRLERLTRRVLGSSNDSEDIVHDAFLRAYVAELGDATELSAALLTVTARRLALNEIRNRARRATDIMGDMSHLGVYFPDDDPASHLACVELRCSIEKAMAEMPPQCRRVFELRRLDGHSHAEIVARLGISAKMVERHLTRALRICRARLIEDGHMDDAFGKAVSGSR